MYKDWMNEKQFNNVNIKDGSNILGLFFKMTHIMPDLKYIPSSHTLDEDTFIGLYKEKRLRRRNDLSLISFKNTDSILYTTFIRIECGIKEFVYVGGQLRSADIISIS